MEYIICARPGMLKRVEITLCFQAPADRLNVEIREVISDEVIPDVLVFIDGKQARSTSQFGTCSFVGRFQGKHTFWATESECHLTLEQLNCIRTSSSEIKFLAHVKRTLTTVVMVRNHIRLDGRRLSESDELIPGIRRDAMVKLAMKSPPDPSVDTNLHGIDSGHWWTVVHDQPYSNNPPRSYGWYPARKLRGPADMIVGTTGILNDRAGVNADPFKDPKHFTPPGQQDEYFMPFAQTGDTPIEIKQTIHDYAIKFQGSWAYRFGLKAMNCHQFQRDIMNHAGLSEATSDWSEYQI